MFRITSYNVCYTKLLRTDTNGTSSNNADEGIQPVEEAIWINFLTTNDINSFAIGIGTGLPANAQTVLDPIAYNGEGTGTDQDAFVITDMNELRNNFV